MIWDIEKPLNDVDTIPTYAVGTKEREELLAELEKIRESPLEIPLIIDGKEVKTDDILEIKCPHDHDLTLARAHLAGEDEIKEAIESSMSAKEGWSGMDFYHRLFIFKRAATLMSGPLRTRNTAAIMMNQSKNPYESEIDLAELVDFFNFNAAYARRIFEEQPKQSSGESNRLDWRPLEGFVFAVPPFNFYSIAGNLPTAPAMVGNVALWKPSRTVILSNYEIMKILLEAGLPPGVINFIPFRSSKSSIITEHPDFAGLHFTGSYDTLVKLWKIIGNNVENYKSFPRIVGETGGKDFIVIHKTANVRGAALNSLRGAYGYQGQKCSAASRAYVPESLWEEYRKILVEEISKIKVGPVEDLSNYMGAIIDKPAYDKIMSYIDVAKGDPDTYEIITGGEGDPSKGWFVKPTVVRSKDPRSKLMSEEIFGPVLTVHVYEDDRFEEILDVCNSTSPYALTGAVFAEDRYAITLAEEKLRFAAGNFYINDKPTAAIVGRQPFGGSRHSGTNDKAGSILNIMRWVQPRNIKETALHLNAWERGFL